MLGERKLAVVFIVRLFVLLFVSYIAPRFIPYLGFFPYREVIQSYGLPQSIHSLANFDGAHYLSIAREGYHTYDQAFFPLYPLLIRYLAPVFFGNHLVAALTISNITFLGGTILFYRLIKARYGKKTAAGTLLFLMAAPTAFFFSAVYTEGLFFFLFTATLWGIEKGNVRFASLSGALASLSRLIGGFLTIPFFILLSGRYRMLSFAPLVGLVVYMSYLNNTTGDPLFFLTSQPAFGANRSTSIILLPQVLFRYAKIFVRAARDFAYGVALFEFVTFVVVFTVLAVFLKMALDKKDRFGLSLGLFSFANLILPTLTGTLSSIPRYMLFCPVFFVYLAQLKSKRTRFLVLSAFAILQTIVFSFFIQGYFVS